MKFLPRRKSKIFVSYRREDSGGHSGRLYADLTRHYGRKQVFRDIDAIKAGEEFEDVIDRSVRSCHVLIAVIGKQWLTITDGSVRRLEKPDDFVRLEITKAFEQRIPVIPTLVQDANLPLPQELPADLKPLTQRHAFDVSDERWDYDVKRLITRLDEVVPEQPIEWRKIVAAIGCVAIVVVGTWLIFRFQQARSLANTNSLPQNTHIENTNSVENTNNTFSNVNTNNSTPGNSPNGNISPTPPQPTVADFDVVKDFSTTTNPKGVWSYGYINPGASPSSASFTLFTHHGTHYDNFSGRTFEGVHAWKLALPEGTPVGTDFGLMVAKNLTSQRIDKLAAGEVVIHPGVGGYYGAVRWKAPADGVYSINGQFTGIGGDPTITDVHVLLRGREIFSAQLNDYLRPHKFSQNVTVISGDSIDFVVGQGSDNQIWGDSTGFQVQIAKVR